MRKSGSPTPGQRVKSGIAVLISLVVLIGGGLFVGRKVYDRYLEWRQEDDYIGLGEADIVITVPELAGLSEVAEICQANDVIKSATTFIRLANRRQNPIVQAGSYRMRTKLPAATALDILTDPSNQVDRDLTVIPEGWAIWQVVDRLTEISGLPRSDFEEALAQAASDPSLIGLPAYSGGQAEGFLFPDSYVLPTLASSMLSRMTTRFAEIARELELEDQAAELGLTPYEVVIVASLIEAEVRRDEDRPKVARAIYNRLDQDMRLQIDSAVNYGLHYTSNVLSQAELDTDTPYNTYMHTGLPPTPIRSPGRAALIAALHPAEGDWLYWVAVDMDTGETRFAVTYEEHLANRELMSQWCDAHPGNGGC
ncbi:MAG: endolytic transglycosylase MltG [Propionibacteriaceae bacterium]|nr:endolytic transglycosylase MltG [Propionibacteriaceae bacterium]